jgi:general secretion pathway protein N
VKRRAAAWAAAGALLGGAMAGFANVPAAWVAEAAGNATSQRLLLADARGTLWSGSGVLVLTGGLGSRDASALPGRLQWQLGLSGAALSLTLRHACCLSDELALRLTPGFGSLRLELPPGRNGQNGQNSQNSQNGTSALNGPKGLSGVNAPGGAASGPEAIGHWPAAWLEGLGTPWNTLRPSGTLLLRSPGMVLQQSQGGWHFSGAAQLELVSMASSISTLDTLGSYRLSLSGDAAAAADAARAAGAGATQLELTTLSGALQLAGSGQFGGAGGRLRFNGRASAAPDAEAALANLLNIIGRREGAVSHIAIG